MTGRLISRMALAIAVLITGAIVTCSTTGAEEILKYSCSAQIYEAFGQERLDAFNKETGVKVELYISTSGASVYRLMNGFSDIASTARPLYYRHKESGYVEIPFARDPIAVITHESCTVKDITDEQLQQIFSGEIKNWKDVGGPDQPVIVIVPGKDTGSYKNFDRLVMDRKEIVYDLMTNKSTMAIETVKQFPWSISFISYGAAVTKAVTKTLKVNGVDPKDKGYPYYQTFSFVTKGAPAGSAKKFIDFALSDKGQQIMTDKGMVPIHN